MPAQPLDVLSYAAGLVQRQLHQVAEPALERLRAENPYYADPGQAPPALRELVYTELDVALASMASPARVAESGEFAREVGRARAEQGIPLAAVVHAFRLGGAACWNRMVDAVLHEAPELTEPLLRAAPTAWAFTDRDTRLMADAHRRSTDPVDPHREAPNLRPVLEFLLHGSADPIALSGAGLILDLPLNGRYAVARISGGPLVGAAGRVADEERTGIRLLACPAPDGQTVLALLGDATSAQLAAALGTDTRARCGIGPAVEGLHALGRARRLADAALGTCSLDGETAILGERFPAGLMSAQPELAAALAAHVLAPVRALPAADRDVLLQTLAVWLDCDGSAQRAGQLLYCHRNTVHLRLRRLERLTGRSLARPRDVVELTLALDALRLGR